MPHTPQVQTTERGWVNERFGLGRDFTESQEGRKHGRGRGSSTVYAMSYAQLVAGEKRGHLPFNTDILDATTADSTDLFLQFPAGESTTGAGISTGRFA